MKWRGAPLPLSLSLSLSSSTMTAQTQHSCSCRGWMDYLHTHLLLDAFFFFFFFFFFCAEPPLVSSQWSLRKPARLVPALTDTVDADRWPRRAHWSETSFWLQSRITACWLRLFFFSATICCEGRSHGAGTASASHGTVRTFLPDSPPFCF